LVAGVAHRQNQQNIKRPDDQDINGFKGKTHQLVLSYNGFIGGRQFHIQ
jgi:hypothetical protein